MPNQLNIIDAVNKLVDFFVALLGVDKDDLTPDFNIKEKFPYNNKSWNQAIWILKKENWVPLNVKLENLEQCRSIAQLARVMVPIPEYKWTNPGSMWLYVKAKVQKGWLNLVR